MHRQPERNKDSDHVDRSYFDPTERDRVPPTRPASLVDDPIYSKQPYLYGNLLDSKILKWNSTLADKLKSTFSSDNENPEFQIGKAVEEYNQMRIQFAPIMNSYDLHAYTYSSQRNAEAKSLRDGWNQATPKIHEEKKRAKKKATVKRPERDDLSETPAIERYEEAYSSEEQEEEITFNELHDAISDSRKVADQETEIGREFKTQRAEYKSLLSEDFWRDKKELEKTWQLHGRFADYTSDALLQFYEKFVKPQIDRLEFLRVMFADDPEKRKYIYNCGEDLYELEQQIMESMLARLQIAERYARELGHLKSDDVIRVTKKDALKNDRPFSSTEFKLSIGSEVKFIAPRSELTDKHIHAFRTHLNKYVKSNKEVSDRSEQKEKEALDKKLKTLKMFTTPEDIQRQAPHRLLSDPTICFVLNTNWFPDEKSSSDDLSRYLTGTQKKARNQFPFDNIDAQGHALWLESSRVLIQKAMARFNELHNTKTKDIIADSIFQRLTDLDLAFKAIQSKEADRVKTLCTDAITDMVISSKVLENPEIESLYEKLVRGKSFIDRAAEDVGSDKKLDLSVMVMETLASLINSSLSRGLYNETFKTNVLRMLLRFHYVAMSNNRKLNTDIPEENIIAESLLDRLNIIEIEFRLKRFAESKQDHSNQADAKIESKQDVSTPQIANVESKQAATTPQPVANVEFKQVASIQADAKVESKQINSNLSERELIIYDHLSLYTLKPIQEKYRQIELKPIELKQVPINNRNIQVPANLANYYQNLKSGKVTERERFIGDEKRQGLIREINEKQPIINALSVTPVKSDNDLKILLKALKASTVLMEAIDKESKLVQHNLHGKDMKSRWYRTRHSLATEMQREWYEQLETIYGELDSAQENIEIKISQYITAQTKKPTSELIKNLAGFSDVVMEHTHFLDPISLYAAERFRYVMTEDEKHSWTEVDELFLQAYPDQKGGLDVSVENFIQENKVWESGPASIIEKHANKKLVLAYRERAINSIFRLAQTNHAQAQHLWLSFMEQRQIGSKEIPGQEESAAFQAIIAKHINDAWSPVTNQLIETFGTLAQKQAWHFNSISKMLGMKLDEMTAVIRLNNGVNPLLAVIDMQSDHFSNYFGEDNLAKLRRYAQKNMLDHVYSKQITGELKSDDVGLIRSQAQKDLVKKLFVLGNAEEAKVATNYLERYSEQEICELLVKAARHTLSVEASLELKSIAAILSDQEAVVSVDVKNEDIYYNDYKRPIIRLCHEKMVELSEQLQQSSSDNVDVLLAAMEQLTTTAGHLSVEKIQRHVEATFRLVDLASLNLTPEVTSFIDGLTQGNLQLENYTTERLKGISNVFMNQITEADNFNPNAHRTVMSFIATAIKAAELREQFAQFKSERLLAETDKYITTLLTTIPATEVRPSKALAAATRNQLMMEAKHEAHEWEEKINTLLSQCKWQTPGTETNSVYRNATSLSIIVGLVGTDKQRTLLRHTLFLNDMQKILYSSINPVEDLCELYVKHRPGRKEAINQIKSELSLHLYAGTQIKIFEILKREIQPYVSAKFDEANKQVFTELLNFYAKPTLVAEVKSQAQNAPISQADVKVASTEVVHASQTRYGQFSHPLPTETQPAVSGRDPITHCASDIMDEVKKYVKEYKKFNIDILQYANSEIIKSDRVNDFAKRSDEFAGRQDIQKTLRCSDHDLRKLYACLEIYQRAHALKNDGENLDKQKALSQIVNDVNAHFIAKRSLYKSSEFPSTLGRIVSHAKRLPTVTVALIPQV